MRSRLIDSFVGSEYAGRALSRPSVRISDYAVNLLLIQIWTIIEIPAVWRQMTYARLRIIIYEDVIAR